MDWCKVLLVRVNLAMLNALSGAGRCSYEIQDKEPIRPFHRRTGVW